MTDESLRTLLRDGERSRFRIGFMDGEYLLAEVIDASHVDLNDTVVVLRHEALPGEAALQVRLSEIRSVAMPDGSACSTAYSTRLN
jgi:hypothetical protein